MAKSHLIIGEKFQIMLHILAAFWEIWLDIVLSTSFLEPLEQLLGSKSHFLIGQKFEIMLDIISVFWDI